MLSFLFFDALLKKLASIKIGCNVRGMFINALCYADDLILMSPTLNGLQRLVDICEEFANLNDMEFNVNKSEKTLNNKFIEKRSKRKRKIIKSFGPQGARTRGQGK